jgi:hypothetical protein
MRHAVLKYAAVSGAFLFLCSSPERYLSPPHHTLGPR